MSKAFTKESDADRDDEGEADEPVTGLPEGSRNYMTPVGASRLREELKRLLTVDRPEVVRTVAWAASNGDRSENGDYIYGKRRLREIDRRIRFLSKRLDGIEIVDPAEQAKRNPDQVQFGASVTIRDEEDRTKNYRIVGIDEANAGQGDVSWISPIAKALLGARVGDAVTLRTPRGEEELEVMKVEYRA